MARKAAVSADVKFPQVKVRLTGEDGNAFFVMGRVARAMRRAGISNDDVAAFYAEAKSGDYSHLLRTCMRTVDCS